MRRFYLPGPISWPPQGLELAVDCANELDVARSFAARGTRVAGFVEAVAVADDRMFRPSLRRSGSPRASFAPPRLSKARRVTNGIDR